MGRELSDGESDLATELGTDRAILRLSRRDPQGHLHHQHDRVVEHVAAQNHQDARLVSQRRRRHEATVSGTAQRFEKMDDAGSGLERSLKSLQHLVAGALAYARAHLTAPARKARKGDL